MKISIASNVDGNKLKERIECWKGWHSFIDKDGNHCLVPYRSIQYLLMSKKTQMQLRKNNDPNFHFCPPSCSNATFMDIPIATLNSLDLGEIIIIEDF